MSTLELALLGVVLVLYGAGAWVTWRYLDAVRAMAGLTSKVAGVPDPCLFHPEKEDRLQLWSAVVWPLCVGYLLLHSGPCARGSTSARTPPPRSGPGPRSS